MIRGSGARFIAIVFALLLITSAATSGVGAVSLGTDGDNINAATNNTSTVTNETTPASNTTSETSTNADSETQTKASTPESNASDPNGSHATENKTNLEDSNTTEKSPSGGVNETESVTNVTSTNETDDANVTATPVSRNGTTDGSAESWSAEMNGSTNASGTTEVIVRVEEFEVPAVSTMSQDDVVSNLKAHANETQKPVINYAESTDGVTVLNRYWITNAVLLEVDTNKVNASEITTQPGVTDVHENFEVDALSTTASGTTTVANGSRGAATTRQANSSATSVTYGLDQLNVPEVWSEHGTRGSGAKVAVLDTGVDASHQDIDLYSESPTDETYPGGWAEFNSDGERVEGSTPHATSNHGTHVSGTVAGGDASGTAVGVAPDAALMHGLVLPEGTGSFSQIIGGMQWAVEEDADVISMSLGAEGYYSTLIEPVRNAKDAGTVVVVASGNNGRETTSAPGNIYDSMTVGASDSNRDIAHFSSGAVVRTERDWGDAARSDWPDEYVVPDVAAPGVDTYSTLPGGEYGEASGTSMATPHIAGVVALMVSASGGELSPSEVEAALTESTTKPADAPAGRDNRYGSGIVNALAATTSVAADQGVTGTVRNTDGDALSDASVELSNGGETATNASGDYLVRTLPGTYNATVSQFGYADSEAAVRVDQGTMTTHDVRLDPILEAEVTDSQNDQVEAGSAATVTYRTAHADNVTITRTGNASGNATLYVNGAEREFGEPVAIESGDDTVVDVRVVTEAGASGTLALTHEIAGSNGTTALTTGPTVVVADPVYVGVVDSSDSRYAAQVQTAVESNVPDSYFVSVISHQEALENVDEYDVFVVHRVRSSDDLASFVEETSGPDTGVVYLDQWGASSNGVTRLSEATQNPVVTGETTDTDRPAYDVVEDHAIFDGIASSGESITLHNQSRGDIAWFERHRGTTLATASDDGEELGTGVSVDESTQTVLLSSLGRTSSVRNAYVNDSANALLGNAVTYANSRPPAWFKSTQSTHVTPGESFTTEIAADDLESLTVTLTDDTTLDSSNLTLSINGTDHRFGESYAVNDSTETVPITISTTAGQVGSIGLSVQATGEEQTVELLGGQTSVYAAPLVVPEDVDTIQQALDLVPAGRTVEVAPGTYTNPVEITKPGVTLTAHADERPTIKTAPGYYNPAVYVDAPNVTVENVNIVSKGSAPRGLEVQRSNATIQNVSVRGAVRGILIGGTGSSAHDTVVKDVRVSESADFFRTWGIVIGKADRVRVSNATVSGQKLPGIDVHSSTGTVIENSTVTDSAAGITSFDTNQLRIVNNDIHDLNEEVSASPTVGIQLEDFVTNTTVKGNDVSNVSEGVFVQGINTGGTIVENDIDGEYGVWVERADVPAVDVRYNDLSGTTTPLGSGTETSFQAPMNYLGDRGANATITEGNVSTYEPFLTAPPEDVDTDEPRQIGVDLTLEAGNIYRVSVPGVTQQTVDDLFDDDFQGVVYGFDANEQTWIQLSGDDQVAALQGLAVVAESDGRMTSTSYVGSNQPSAPAQRSLTEGWNFVGATRYDDIESAFNVATVDPGLAMAPFEAPGSQPGSSAGFDSVYRFDGSSGSTPDVSAYEGYFVFIENESTLPSHVTPNPTATELYQGIGLYSLNASENAAATNTTASVNATLAEANETSSDAVYDALSRVIYYDLVDATGGTDDSRAAIRAAANETVASAPDDRETLVANATADARSRLLGDSAGVQNTTHPTTNTTVDAV